MESRQTLRGPLFGSLNGDPYNLRAEELAKEECMRGIDVRREWSEKQMVGSFGGCDIPGTPDAMFEDHEGRLTCVQVVRVPFFVGMSAAEIAEVTYQTVLTKAVKSQAWMKATRILPADFIIFCWYPFQPPEGTGARAQALVEKLRSAGWPFSLRGMLPAEPDALFPLKFAWSRHGREGGCMGRRTSKKGAISEADLSLFTPSDFETDDEEETQWDLFGSTDADESSAESGCELQEGGDSSRPGLRQLPEAGASSEHLPAAHISGEHLPEASVSSELSPAWAE